MEQSMPLSEAEVVGRRLVELCEQGQHMQAMEELYAENARHVEAFAMPDNPHGRVTEGKANLVRAAGEFFSNLEFHGGGIGKAYPCDNQFIVEQWMDVTFKEGPMAGQRFEMREMSLYTVENGKITEAKFFYGME